jgi:transcription initiation factor TFIID subunit 1
LIPRIYAVGQTYPAAEVPPPHSRKIKAYVRDRLQVAAFRRIKRKGRNCQFRIAKIINAYHQYHEQSLRKHVEENFAVTRSGGRNQPCLSMRPTARIPTDEELYKMVTPENVCIFEAVRAGQQRLIDAGYGAGEIEEMEDVDDQEESKLDAEVQLSPWVQAKNFRLASQGKAMVKIYGAGDPTGAFITPFF